MKRARDAELEAPQAKRFVLEDDNFEFDVKDIPSDTLAAVQNIAETQNPKRVVLRHQVYTLVRNRTTVDRELDKLRRDGKIRMVELPNIGRDCQGIMLVADYASTVREIMEKENNDAIRRVGERFLEVLSSIPFSDVSRTKLLTLLGKPFQSSPTSSISNLIRIGVLTRKGLSDYHVAIPAIGTFVVDIKKARKEIISIVKKRMYREILQKELEKKSLKTSRMSLRYHLMDLEGLQLLDFVETNMGTLVRIPKEDFKEKK
uniref:Uncharacterized protein n=1 Tax=Lotharella globosa TaxID=91324 RepID=A0A7S4DYL1_9EUKA|mmetsp:Transcript_12577/g.25604  ORF Transcript_12577/g.25604 Transcript_12577/m.25604 type:complete len:260 (+) Transcript_12577:56-835(+)